VIVGRTTASRVATEVLVDERRNLLLHGPAGIGKSTLARLWCAGQPDGATLLVIGLPDAATPLAPFADLLGEAEPSQLPLELLVRIRGEIGRRAARGLRTVVVDDAHWLDPLSASLVRQLTNDSEITVALVFRDGAATPEELAWASTDASFDRLELGPLTRAATEELLSGLLGGELDAGLAEDLWTLSAGVPLFAIEALRTARLSGSVERVGGRWSGRGPVDLPSGIAQVIDEHIGQLDPDARRLLMALGLGGPLRHDVVERLPGSDRLELLVREGLAAFDSEVVDVGHELHRRAVLARPEPLALRATTRALVAALEVPPVPPDEVLLAARLRRSVGDHDPAAYEAGAAAAFHRFDMELSMELAELAIDHGARFGALLTGAAAAGALGRTGRSAELFAAARDGAGDEGELVQATIASAADAVLFRADPGGALEILDRGTERVASPEARTALAAFEATTCFYGGQLDRAVAVGAEIVDHGGVTPELAVPLCSAWAVLGEPDRVLDTFDRAVATLPRRSEPPYFVFHNLPWTRLLALWQLGRLAEVRDPYEPFRRRDLGRSALSSDLARIAMPATHALLSGRLDEASEGYRSLGATLDVQPMHVATFNHILVATIEGLRGDVAAAERALRQVRVYPPEARAGFRWWERRAGMTVTVARGDVDGAVAEALDMAEAHAAERFHAITSRHDVVRLGRPDLVRAELEGAAAAARSTWWERACAAHARALDERDAHALIEVSDTFRAGGLLLHAFEAAGHADRAARSSDTGSGAAARARMSELAGACGTSVARRNGPPDGLLTPRESQVARLAADGHANKEIAALLGISARTVGNQLQHVYQKLGIHHRESLAAALDPPADPSPGRHRPDVGPGAGRSE
jgi:DNA-binding CsgD family transcriptional regulator